MTGCKTTKIKNEIQLPPRPQREIQKAPQDLRDYANLINYYEHLVQEWEMWGDTVADLLKE